MSLLDKLPHECTIQRRVRTKGTLGGSKDSATVEQTAVECWQQQASASQATEFEKRGMNLQAKIYFTSDPGVTRRHQIVVTSRNGTTVPAASRITWDVLDVPAPDVSVGRGLLWRVMCGFNRGEDD